jgi:hypothetical protein
MQQVQNKMSERKQIMSILCRNLISKEIVIIFSTYMTLSLQIL